ncbi:unnamed protein product, partial [Staurois parvus]
MGPVPPIAAVSIATLCHVGHFQVLLTLPGVFHFVIGCWQITGLPLLLPARNLPWAPVPPPHAAARSQMSLMVLYGLPLLLSPIATLCHALPLSGLLTLLCVCSILS